MKLVEGYWYVVQAEGIRPHFCGNYYLAAAVANNIERRYEVNTTIERYNDTLPVLALNGSQLTKSFNLTPFTFPVTRRKTITLPGEVTVSWNEADTKIPQYLKEDYEKAVKEKTYDNFYKFHTGVGTLCMTQKQMEKLLEFSAM